MKKEISIFFGSIITLFMLIFGLQSYIDYTITETRPYLKDHHFVIVVCSYNNISFYKKNIDSILCQDYPHYSVVYVDDNSPDGTYDAVHEYLKEHSSFKDKFTLIKNPLNTRQLRNTYYAIHNFSKNDDIVIILDGDDWFAHNQVLSVLNTLYQDSTIWMTCGNYIQDRGFLLVPNFNPPHTYDTDTLRSSYSTPPPHLRSFYSWLFKQIQLEDLVSEGSFIPMAADMAYLFPMLEMAKDHYYPMQQALYIYNTSGALNCYHNQKSKELQAQYSKIVMQKTPYLALDAPATAQPLYEPLASNGLTLSELQSAQKVMADTKASLFTIAVIDKKIDIKPEHCGYLYDNFWTYQLGWQPQLPYEYHVVSHILNPHEENMILKGIVDTSAQSLITTQEPSLATKMAIVLLRPCNN